MDIRSSLAKQLTVLIHEGRSETYVLGWLAADTDLFWHRPYDEGDGEVRDEYRAGYQARWSEP